MIFPSFQIKFKLQTNFKSVFTGQRQFHTVDPSFSTNWFENCHFWSKTTLFWRKMNSISMKTVMRFFEIDHFYSNYPFELIQGIIFVEKWPFLIKIDPFHKWIESTSREVLWVFSKWNIFDQNSLDSSWLVQESVLCRIK